MDTTAQRKMKALTFAREYRELQRDISRVTGAPLPPCYFCTASCIWSCSRTRKKCPLFERYCSTTPPGSEPEPGTTKEGSSRRGRKQEAVAPAGC